MSCVVTLINHYLLLKWKLRVQTIVSAVVILLRYFSSTFTCLKGNKTFVQLSVSLSPWWLVYYCLNGNSQFGQLSVLLSPCWVISQNILFLERKFRFWKTVSCVVILINRYLLLKWKLRVQTIVCAIVTLLSHFSSSFRCLKGNTKFVQLSVSL